MGLIYPSSSKYRKGFLDLHFSLLNQTIAIPFSVRQLNQASILNFRLDMVYTYNKFKCLKIFLKWPLTFLILQVLQLTISLLL